MHYPEAVVHVVTGSTLHPGIEEHIIVDTAPQTTIGSSWRKQSPVTGGQGIGIVKGDGMIGTQIITCHSPDAR